MMNSPPHSGGTNTRMNLQQQYKREVMNAIGKAIMTGNLPGSRQPGPRALTHGKSKFPNKVMAGTRRRDTSQDMAPLSGDMGLQGKSASAAAAYSRQQRPKAPKFTRTLKGARIHHRELVTTIMGTTSFTVAGYPCNPGISTTFPWLAPQAVQWEQYKFHSLKFEYITRTGSSTAGSVLMAPDYDATDVPPPSEQIISTYQNVVEDVVWRDICCYLNVESMHALGNRKFVRSQAIAGTDLKTYDVANFFIATTGEADTSIIGKLWVEYDVELFVPQTNISTGISTGPQVSTVLASFNNQNMTTGVAANIMFDHIIADPLFFNGGSLVPPAGGVYTPQKGTYIITTNVAVEDTQIEAVAGTLSIRKNGVSVWFSTFKGAGAASSVHTLSTCYPISFNGTDTFDINVTIIGALGILNLLGDNTSCVITLA